MMNWRFEIRRTTKSSRRRLPLFATLVQSLGFAFPDECYRADGAGSLCGRIQLGSMKFVGTRPNNGVPRSREGAKWKTTLNPMTELARPNSPKLGNHIRPTDFQLLRRRPRRNVSVRN